MTAILLTLILAQPIPPDAVTLKVPKTHLGGQDAPVLEVRINHPITDYSLSLTRSDGRTFKLDGSGRPGSVRKLPLPQPAGRLGYAGQLEVRFPGEQVATMALDFAVEVLEPLRLTLTEDDVDLDQRALSFRASRPVRRAHLEVQMDTGELAFDEEVALEEQPGGAPLRLTWPEKPGRVLRMHLTAWDAADFYDSVEVTPWQLDIPHREVNFATAKWDIPKSEEPKLAESLAEVQAAVRRYGRLAKLRLFVLGHTDTVGAPADNDRLSRQRARSIARYFRERGLKIPVLFEGVGEQAPAVRTADETDEPRNRRAEYILAIDTPTLTVPTLRPRWQSL